MPNEEQIKSNRMATEDLDRRLKLLEEKEEPVIEEKPFQDIPFDPMRKIDQLTLGNTDGITKVRAYLQTAAQEIPDATWTKVTLNGAAIDALDEMDLTTNHRWTSKKKQDVLVCAGAFYLLSVADRKYYAEIKKNGTTVLSNITQSSMTDTDIVPAVANVIPVETGDYLELWVYHNSGAAKDLYHLLQRTFMTIYQLS